MDPLCVWNSKGNVERSIGLVQSDRGSVEIHIVYDKFI